MGKTSAWWLPSDIVAGGARKNAGLRVVGEFSSLFCLLMTREHLFIGMAGGVLIRAPPSFLLPPPLTHGCAWQKHEQCVEDAGDQPALAQMWQKQPPAQDMTAAASHTTGRPSSRARQHEAIGCLLLTALPPAASLIVRAFNARK